MRRSMRFVFLALALALIVASPAGGSARDANPPCADVVDAARSYDGTTLTVTLDLSAPACDNHGYTLFVSDEDGQRRPTLTSTTNTSVYVSPSSDRSLLTFTISPHVDPDGVVWIWAETRKNANGALIDRAPDLDAVCLTVGGVSTPDCPGGARAMG